MAFEFVAFTDKESVGIRVQNEPPRLGTFRLDHCANCDAALEMTNRSLFCGKGCQDQASLIRYLRNGIETGKFLPVALRFGIIRDENEAKAVYSRCGSRRPAGTAGDAGCPEQRPTTSPETTAR